MVCALHMVMRRIHPRKVRRLVHDFVVRNSAQLWNNLFCCMQFTQSVRVLIHSLFEEFTTNQLRSTFDFISCKCTSWWKTSKTNYGRIVFRNDDESLLNDFYLSNRVSWCNSTNREMKPTLNMKEIYYKCCFCRLEIQRSCCFSALKWG